LPDDALRIVMRGPTRGSRGGSMNARGERIKLYVDEHLP